MANENIISGLQTEREGYEARVAQAESVPDAERADYYRARIVQVDAALKKLGVTKASAAKAAAAEDAK